MKTSKNLAWALFLGVALMPVRTPAQLLTDNRPPAPRGSASTVNTAPAPSPASTPAAAEVAKPVIEPVAPFSIKIGSAWFTPVGFADFTMARRDTNTGNGIATSFGSIPFADSTAGNLNELRFSGQNSRLGLRIDTKVQNARVLGYFEADFFGYVPVNAAVTGNADSFRMRLYFVDVSKGKWEGLAGQSWSLMTPNRNGLSPMPADLFISQSLDSNYHDGLIWTRSAQIRGVYHAAKGIAIGVSLEGPEQYIGGSSGGGVVVLPSSLASAYATQLDNGTTSLTVPNSRPDIVAKIAFDYKPFGHGLHFEVAGVSRSFKTYNPTSKQTFTANGEGASSTLIFEAIHNVRLVTSNFYSDGGGRYICGLAPDLVVRGDGSLSPVHSMSTVSGVEVIAGRMLFYSYYGGTYIGRNVAIDPANGKSVGYGFTGSGTGQNRAIQETTIGAVRTIWKNPAYGALALGGQYSYFFRNPWYVAPGALPQAESNTAFVSLRFTLPGAAPAIK